MFNKEIETKEKKIEKEKYQQWKTSNINWQDDKYYEDLAYALLSLKIHGLGFRIVPKENDKISVA